MKLYILYLDNPDTNEYDQFVGVFDSIEKCKQEILKLSEEIDCELTENDYEVSEKELNLNYLTIGQIMPE